MHVTQEVHVRSSAAGALVLHQEVAEDQLIPVLLLHHHQLQAREGRRARERRWERGLKWETLLSLGKKMGRTNSWLLLENKRPAHPHVSRPLNSEQVHNLSQSLRKWVVQHRQARLEYKDKDLIKRQQIQRVQ